MLRIEEDVAVDSEKIIIIKCEVCSDLFYQLLRCCGLAADWRGCA